MGNSLRCCIACLLPCGALDVIRVVHLNGHVDEFSRSVSAHEILDANPGHVLSTPCSSQGGVAGRILIVSPESELKRGAFYFLIPAASVPDKKKKKQHHKNNNKDNSKARKMSNSNSENKVNNDVDKALDQDKYLEDILSEKSAGVSKRMLKRSKRVGVWRPHLESISEDS